ncbi:MAG: delta-60 repeat domain-containing protein, partial [Chloroflexi bacterium]|nr:delta-60 repeat domain-containing protein [Chloroflexota bacterium]
MAFDGAPAESIVQLGTDGRRDASFASRGPGQNGEVLALVRQPDGKLLVGMNAGLFDYQRLNATRRNGIGRLNADGTTDTAFVSPLSANATVAGITLQPDGKLIVTGSFTAGSRTDFARLNADGSLDASFDPQIEGSVAAVAVRPGGKVLIGGTFTRLNGAFSQRIARLDADGGTATSFTAAIAAGGVSALAVQPAGRILVGGVFAVVNSTPRNNLARLEPDGSLDLGFDPGGGPDDAVRALLPRADGKIVIGGIFRSYGGTPRDGMARIHATGALDASFDPVNPGGRRLGGMAQYPDGRVVVGSTYRGDTALPPPNRVLRLDVDGKPDPAFALGTGVEGTSVNVNAILLDGDDGIVLGGEFDVINGGARLGLARLLGAVRTSPSSTTTTTTSTSSSSSSITDTTTSSTTVITSSTTTVPVAPTTSTTLPCMLSALPVDSVAGVRCAIDRVRRTLEEPTPLACTRCKRCALQPALDRVARLVDEADAAVSGKACQKRLKSARGAAKALRGRVRSLAQRRCFEPADRAPTLTADVEALHGRMKAVSRSAWCRSPGVPGHAGLDAPSLPQVPSYLESD